MGTTRVQVEIQKEAAGSGGALAIPPILIATGGDVVLPSGWDGGPEIVTLRLMDNGFVVERASAPAGKPTAFGEWYRGPGWKLRISQSDDALADRSLADNPAWAAPEIQIVTVDGSKVKQSLRRLPTEEGGKLIMGRDPESAEVVVEDDHISRKHLKFYVSGGKQMVEDVGSRWGTKINGAKLSVPVALKHGDELRLGKTTVRYICYMDVLPGSQSPEPPATGGMTASKPQAAGKALGATDELGNDTPPTSARDAGAEAAKKAQEAAKKAETATPAPKAEAPKEAEPARPMEPKKTKETAKTEEAQKEPKAPKKSILKRVLRLDVTGAIALVLLILAGLCYVGWVIYTRLLR